MCKKDRKNKSDTKLGEGLKGAFVFLHAMVELT